ncbi:PAP2-domain-containing protein [Backusella circina FSU 941]|nr:PAP2-domain-containing protein [Backusella circina FSU 941]
MFKLLKNKRNRLLFLSYFKDWVLVVVMIIIFFGINLIDPFHREFSITDQSLMHSRTIEEEVPVWLLVLLAIIIPAVMVISISLIVYKRWAYLHNGLLGLAVSLAMTIMITDIIKITSGRPRPDMFAICQPPEGIQDPPLGLLNYTICTQPHDSYEFEDAFKSFPSGHSSFSFAGLGYLSFFFAGKMHMFDGRGHTYKSFVCAVPLLGALLVAISRVRDYRHHWSDVFVGGIIGIVFAYFAYRQYHPSLASDECHEPYEPRIKRPEDLFPRSNTDIEAAASYCDSSSSQGDGRTQPTVISISNSKQMAAQNEH